PNNTLAISGYEGRLGVIRTQIAEAQALLAGAEGMSMGALIQQFDLLQAQAATQLELFMTASNHYQAAAQQASSQQIYLQPWVNPVVPEASAYPRRLWFTVQIAAVLLGLWGIAVLIFFATRDHRS